MLFVCAISYATIDVPLRILRVITPSCALKKKSYLFLVLYMVSRSSFEIYMYYMWGTVPQICKMISVLHYDSNGQESIATHARVVVREGKRDCEYFNTPFFFLFFLLPSDAKKLQNFTYLMYEKFYKTTLLMFFFSLKKRKESVSVVLCLVVRYI